MTYHHRQRSTILGYLSLTVRTICVTAICSVVDEYIHEKEEEKEETTLPPHRRSEIGFRDRDDIAT